MALRKGQFMLSGLVMLGLVLAFFLISSIDSGQRSDEGSVFENVRDSVPGAVKSISHDYSGQAFMEVFNYYTQKQRVPVTSTSDKLGFTVVTGFREDGNMKVYLGNFRSEEQRISTEVNGHNFSTTIGPDEVVSYSVGANESYSVDVEGEFFDRSFSSLRDQFYMVNFRYETRDAIRQDTYIG